MVVYALAQAGDWSVEPTVAEDGEQALAYVRRERSYTQVEFPQLIILDLNVPKHSGTEILKVIRGLDELRNVPVVILSSSPQDVLEMTVCDAQVWANRYLTKPPSLDEFLEIGKEIRRCYEDAQAS